MPRFYAFSEEAVLIMICFTNWFRQAVCSVVAAAIAVGAAPAQTQQEASLAPPTKWGDRPDRVQHLVGGSVTKGVDSEEVVRAQTTLLGAYSADALYCFHPLLGLSDVSFAVRPVLSTDPTSHERGSLLSADVANEAVAKLTSKLSQTHGKPSHTEESAAGSIAVWRTDSAFVRLWSRVVHGGTHVRLEFSRPESDHTKTFEQQRHLFDRVDKKSWGQKTAMDVHWLMGPGDVRDVYPELTVGLMEYCGPEQSYSVAKFLEGDAEIRFQFYRGQLVSMFVHLPSPRIPKFKSELPQHDEDVKDWWRRFDHWGRTVRGIVTEKYGKPTVAPDPAQEKEAYEKDSTYGDPPLEWWWMSNATAILYRRVTRGMQALIYRYTGPEAIKMLAEAKEYEARKEADRKKPF